MCFFFFQAEDGIRDIGVTGVQTCALPISGLVYRIYRKAYRTQVSRSSEQLKAQSRKVSKSNLQEGDLVFFSNHRSSKRVGHVGIYLKDRKFIHASTGRGVIISSLDEPYYRKHWICGGRVR